MLNLLTSFEQLTGKNIVVTYEANREDIQFIFAEDKYGKHMMLLAMYYQDLDDSIIKDQDEVMGIITEIISGNYDKELENIMLSNGLITYEQVTRAKNKYREKMKQEEAQRKQRERENDLRELKRLQEKYPEAK